MSTLAPPPHAVSAAAPARGSMIMRDAAELTKARLSLLVVFTTLVGYVLGCMTTGGFDWWVMLGVCVGTALAAASSSPTAAQVGRTEVRDVSFVGNRAFPTDSLARAIVTRETECRSAPPSPTPPSAPAATTKRTTYES